MAKRLHFLLGVLLQVSFATAQTHFTFTSNTGNNATVAITTSTNPNIGGSPLQTGDEIGVFTPAGLCVGAVVWQGTNTAITVWGDNDQTPEIDGILVGQEIRYRVWRQSTNTEYSNVSVTYSQGNGIYAVNGIYILASLKAVVSGQTHFTFTANTGNNATVAVPVSANPNIDGTPLSVGDEIGVFTPAGLCVGAVVWRGTNTAITVWGDNDQTPEIDGIRVGEQIHYRVWRQSTNTEYSNVSVTYSQGNGIYAVNGIYVLSSLTAVGGAQTHFTFTSNTGNNATVAVPTSANPNINGTPLSVGDEIGVFTPAGLCVGAVVWRGTNTAITVWGDNDQTPEIDGIRVGEQIHYRVWRQSTNIEYSNVSVTYSQGNGIYAVDGIYVLSSLSASLAAPTLASPLNGAINQPTTLTLRWNAVPGATNYHLQVALDTNFNTPIVNDSTLSDTLRQIGPLANLTRYYWRVRAKNIGGTSVFSEIWNFTTIIAAPATPTLAAPQNGATNEPTTLVLKWNTAPRASMYHLQVATDTLFTTPIVNDSTLTDTLRQIGPLANLTHYYWRVRAKNIGGTSAYSEIWNFTTIIAAPATPTLAAPQNGATNEPTTLVLKWNTAPRASMYHLQVATDTLFTTPIVNDSTLTDTLRQIGPLANLTRYHWRVRAKNIGGTSVFSEIWNFTTIIAAPTMPVLLSPVNGSVGQQLTLTLRWTLSARTDTYHLQVATDSLFLSLVVNDSSVVDTVRSVSGLQPLTTYYWRVQARNIGGTSGFTPPWRFRTLGVPTQVALISPPNNAVNLPTTVTFVWQRALDQTMRPVSGGIGETDGLSEGLLSEETVNRYWFELVNDTTTMAGLVRDTTLTDTTKTLTGLTHLTAYYWRVRANNEIGWGVFSPWWKFTTIIAPPDIPVLASPPNGSVGRPTTDTLKWRVAARASTYRLQVATDTGFMALVVNDSTLTDTTRTISALQPLTTYYWRVNARNASGTSGWSPIWNFTTTIAAPILLDPPNGAANQPTVPTFRWRNSPGATSYFLQVARDSMLTAIVFADSSISDTSRQVGPLEHSTTYYWRVRAQNTSGARNWSEVWSFVTILPLPNSVVLVSPIDTVTVRGDSVQFVWRQSQPAVNLYLIQVSLDSLFAVTRVDSTSDTTKVLGGFHLSHTYWWRVRARNASGWGPFSDSVRFTRIITGISSSEELPREFLLVQNYPNPFNPSTTIRYALPARSVVRLAIYNVLGQVVGELVNSEQDAGYYDVQWTPNTPSGIYFYRVEAVEVSNPSKRFVDVKKMLLLK